jgi:hypothetical protein
MWESKKCNGSNQIQIYISKCPPISSVTPTAMMLKQK